MLRQGTVAFRVGCALREGPLRKALEVAHTAGVSPHGFYYYYYRARRRAPDEPAGFDPFRTLEVPPGDVEYLSVDRFDKWRNLGEVREGDWDVPLMSVESLPVFRALRQRFVEGRAWEDVDQYRTSLSQLWRGKSGWHRGTTRADLDGRCTALDALYDRIASEGYQSQAQLTGLSTADRLRRGGFHRSESDVSVHIARDGTFRFVDGRHRLSIARLLDLDTITVQPVVRHREWQDLRRRMCESGIEAVPPYLRTHPDLLDLSDSTDRDESVGPRRAIGQY